MSNALISRFRFNNHGPKVQLQYIAIKQGAMSIRDYFSEFEVVMVKIPCYNGRWMLNIPIWGLQSHSIAFVVAQGPVRVQYAIHCVEQIKFSFRMSQIAQKWIQS